MNQHKHYGCENYEPFDGGGNCSFCDCKAKRLTPRKLLQLLGTECGREILHPNIWVNALISGYIKSSPGKGGELGAYGHTECIDCKKPFNGYKRQFICNTCHDTHDWLPTWVVTDVRFPNELKAIK